MILDTMTLEELILEIKTDFKEVRGRDGPNSCRSSKK